ncbi:MAG: chorismate synthase [Spirochaetaceae bacterium]|jgi:chorismate synthase|nr:chorismate synthase [Spirochaetaceae bacterium]
MGGNTLGLLFRLTTFGESHGPGLGAVIDGCPAGVPLDESLIQADLDRRKPGAGPVSTGRSEDDRCRILSGVFAGVTTGTPIAIIIGNTSQRPADYGSLEHAFRPGHGDFTYTAKYGLRDHRGGGRSSGRETAGRVAGGAVARAFLEQRLGRAYGVTAYTKRAAGVSCQKIDLSAIEGNPLRAADPDAARAMLENIAALKARGDSAGGVVECVVRGLPAGLGEPVFDKLDGEIAGAMLSLGAVKGIEFGAGFAAADMTGGEMNDPIRASADGRGVVFGTNNAGGVLGGISNGDDLVFRLAVKPPASVFFAQDTVERSGEGAFANVTLTLTGRHDACICPRIVPVAEAMTHLVIADLLLRNDSARL